MGKTVDLGSWTPEETKALALKALNELPEEEAVEAVREWARENEWSEELYLQLEDDLPPEA